MAFRTFPAIQPDRSLLLEGLHQIPPVLLTLGSIPVEALCVREGPIIPDHDQSLRVYRTLSVLAPRDRFRHQLTRCARVSATFSLRQSSMKPIACLELDLVVENTMIFFSRPSKPSTVLISTAVGDCSLPLPSRPAKCSNFFSSCRIC